MRPTNYDRLSSRTLTGRGYSAGWIIFYVPRAPMAHLDPRCSRTSFTHLHLRSPLPFFQPPLPHRSRPSLPSRSGSRLSESSTCSRRRTGPCGAWKLRGRRLPRRLRRHIQTRTGSLCPQDPYTIERPDETDNDTVGFGGVVGRGEKVHIPGMAATCLILSSHGGEEACIPPISRMWSR